jgi:hypothetical protein
VSYDVSVSFKTWPEDCQARWLDEMHRLGIDVAAPDGAFESSGGLTLRLTIAPDATIPWAAAFRALGTFASGFERARQPKRVTLSAKGTEGNAGAIWCAAALAAVTGGKLEDPQCGITTSAPRAIEIIATLMGDNYFVRSFCGPTSMGELPPPGPVIVPAAPLEVAIDASKPTRGYVASSRYDVGDQLAHPAFGDGIVEVSEPGKVTVAFRSGRRVLAQSKTSGEGLARPPRIDHSKPVPGTKPGR